MQEHDMQTENGQKKNKYEIDMTNGTLMDKLISFSLPLMLSGILQLMFNAVDIIVVGRFTGSSALAAVGSTTALINVFTNLFIGISLGANVLAARFYAAGREKEMSETVHTAIALALVSGLIMAVVGVVFAKGALILMDTPADVIGQSALYMRIYFVGMPFFMLYNYGAAILRAVGDTKRPLIFLIVSAAALCIGSCVPNGFEEYPLYSVNASPILPSAPQTDTCFSPASAVSTTAPAPSPNKIQVLRSDQSVIQERASLPITRIF
jgi:Na+-driven multidrug efflux pump